MTRGVYVPTTDDPRVTGRVRLQFMNNSPDVVAEFSADIPDEYNTTLVRALRALADEIESNKD